MQAWSRTPRQSKRTRRALLRAARNSFARRGYAGTSADEIAVRAGVTRGTLYHQFGDKERLFRAVCEEVEKDAVERATRLARAERGTWNQLRAGCQAALDTALDAEYRRIVMQDGPAVLGWAEWREIVNNFGLALLRLGLQTAQEEGLIDKRPLDPLAAVVYGAIMEGGMVIATAEDVRRARKQVGDAIMRLLDGVRVREASRPPRSPSRRR